MIERGTLVDLPLGTRRSLRILDEYARDIEDRMLRALTRLHAVRPRHATIPRSSVAAALPDIGNDALIAAIVARLESEGKLIGDRRTVAIRDWSPKLSQGETRLKNELGAAIRAGGFSPPDLAELTASAGARSAVVPDLLALLRDEERIVEVGHGLYLDFDTDAELRRRVRERLGDGSTMTMSELRDLLGTTRKFAVPIGEYLDRIGITQRVGDARRLCDPPTADTIAPELP
jgi:selenocysteine-specific elongation factor